MPYRGAPDQGTPALVQRQLPHARLRFPERSNMKSTKPKRPSSSSRVAAPFSFSSGMVPYAKKDELVTVGVTFAIAEVVFDPGGGFNGDNRWKVTVIRDDSGAAEIITLPSNEKRDAQLSAAKAHERLRVILGHRRSGNRYRRHVDSDVHRGKKDRQARPRNA
jgi:hypothetical protein